MLEVDENFLFCSQYVHLLCVEEVAWWARRWRQQSAETHALQKKKSRKFGLYLGTTQPLLEKWPYRQKKKKSHSGSTMSSYYHRLFLDYLVASRQAG